MAEESDTGVFPGFPDFQANVTFVPIQFFTVVLPNSSRGCARLVGYMLRQILGWVDVHGNPKHEQLQFSYRDLIRKAGVSRETISDAIREAVDKSFIRCVRPPQAARRGHRGQCGIYELNWDEHGPYADSPEAFTGFYFPEAVVFTTEEPGRSEPRVKAARKNIPNLFFDCILPRERLSVIRVVSALLFYSIQWGKGGERKVPVSLSITALGRLTKLSRQHVHAAVTEALERGFITRLDPGQFDPQAGADSRPATYGVRWASSHSLDKHALTAIELHPEQSEKVHGEESGKVNGPAVGKGERQQSERVHGERSEKVNGISIKTDLNTCTTATEYHGGPQTVDSADAAFASPAELLVEAGFDGPSARFIAGRYSPEIIRQQLEWLPHRKADSNRLGLLRRAIEQNWPKPERPDDPSIKGGGAAETFARYYYAGYHGNVGEPAAEPLGRDIRAADRIVRRLLEIAPDEGSLPRWGREFGAFVRKKQAGDPRAKPFLETALLLYADEFLRRARSQAHGARQQDRLRVQQARKETLESDYYRYLRETELRYHEEFSELYAQFDRQRQQSRKMIQAGLSRELPRVLEWFDAEPARLSAFAKFFRRHPDHPVLSFEQWDASRHRPRPTPAPFQLEEATR